MLARTLEHAKTTPYYECLLQSLPSSASPWERLAEMPVLTRRERSSRPIDFVARSFAPDSASREILAAALSADSFWENETRLQLADGAAVVLEKTSGSTGAPLKMVKTDLERLVAGKTVWKLRKRIDPAVTPCTMFPFEHAPLEFKFPYDLADYSPVNVGACLREIGRRGYTWLHGHPQGLEWWAETIAENPGFETLARFRRIESNGSPLSASARAKIEAAFGCPVVDNYNCREVWTIGYECSSGQMHVNEDCVVVEILRDDGTPAADGEFGSLIVTSLCARAMPFLRYDLGDRLASSVVDCRCGVKGQVIRFPATASIDLIDGHSAAGCDVFSKVTRFLYGSFSFEYDAIRVLEIGRGEFDVWIGGFRGAKEDFIERFTSVSNMLLEPLPLRFSWHFTDPNARIFFEYPRNLFVSAAAALV